MSIQNAKALVEWINSHDDGSPQPRAFTSFDGQNIIIRCLEVHANGRREIVEVIARSVTEVRDTLGY